MRPTGDRGRPETQAPGAGSAAANAIHALLDDLRATPAVPGMRPHATLTSPDPYTRRLASMTYGGASAVDGMAWARAPRVTVLAGAFPPDDACGQQAPVVLVKVPVEPLDPWSEPAGRPLRPDAYLNMLRASAWPGRTELVVVEGADDMVSWADSEAADPRRQGMWAAVQVARTLPLVVGAPVAHVSEAWFRDMLSDCPVFRSGWLWDAETFSFAAGDLEAFAERTRALGLHKGPEGSFQGRPDATSPRGTVGAVCDASGRELASVAPSALAAAVRSCGPGATGVIVDPGDARGAGVHAAIIRYMPGQRA